MRIYQFVILSIVFAGVCSCNGKKTLFQSLSSAQTGVDFINQVEENEKYNVFSYMNIYTGAGVAAGDVNNDGLVDLFFSGNQKSCRLYINRGGMKFDDVTEKVGLVTDRWCTGVSMVDINGDGFLDIYVNVAGSAKFGSTANLLYINNGPSASPEGEGRGEVTFTEKGEAYGLADTRLTMNASFFDYDRDGDLDVFLITNPADEKVDDVATVLRIQKNGESPGTDVLYQNNGDGTFTDVSRKAGILMEGFSLAAAISDVNGDGWPDIYVSNDFLANDILYINNGPSSSPEGEGRGEVTFTDKASECLKHTSYSSMGNDIADYNNDGLPDIFTLDMLPEDNYRRKMIIPAAGYDKYQLMLQKGYMPQYTRNALQLNNGPSPSPDGEGRGEVTFSEIAFLAGVSSTDWSWSSLFADYDNDGDKDLMVTNGFYRDFGDQDFVNYQAGLNNALGDVHAQNAKKLQTIKELASIPLKDYLFENNGDLTFSKRSDDWGFTEPGFSSGACYADLDNDGDLELIINQFNSEAKIFQNNTNELTGNHYLTLKLTGTANNRQAIGAKAYVYTGDKMQVQEANPYRGYESTVQQDLHFGFGKAASADSIKIVWPDGTSQTEYNIAANKTVTISHKRGPVASGLSFPLPPVGGSGLQGFFRDITGTKGLSYTHKESYFADFNFQPLMPHMLSRCGPGMAVGDVNGDGLEDFYVGGASKTDGSLFLQTASGAFTEKKLVKDAPYEDMGVLLFDADGDGDLDLFVVSGSSEIEEGDAAQQDRLYLNDGAGAFRYEAGALPDTRSSGSCVVGADYDKDGDIDLFVGGRVVPGQYPLSPQSYLLKNEGGKFSDVSINELPQRGKTGMVTSALWTDYDNDGWVDLLLAGEFMPLTFIRNDRGKLQYKTPLTIEHSLGWWNSITAGDFDNDGDTDYIIGNLGLNTRFKTSPREPLCIYAKDYNSDGRIDPVMCYYTQGENHVYPTRDEMIKQIAAMRNRFPAYKDFAKADFDEVLTRDERRDAVLVKSECFESSYLENRGGGKFERKALPIQSQFAPLFGAVTGDYNGDGHLDVLLAGNSFATEVSTGAYDALSGLVLAGNGKGRFQPLSAAATGFNASRDAKGAVQLHLADGSSLVLVANNNDAMSSYRFMSKLSGTIPVKQDDSYAFIQRKDGSSYKQEFYHGSTYLSGSSRNISYGDGVVGVTIYDNNGKSRKVQLNDRSAFTAAKTSLQP